MAENNIVPKQASVDVPLPTTKIGSSFERRAEFSPSKITIDDEKSLSVIPISLKDVLNGEAVLDALNPAPPLDRQSSATLAKYLLDTIEKNPVLGGALMAQNFGLDKQLSFDQAKSLLGRISRSDGSPTDKVIPDEVYRQFLNISVAFTIGIQERFDGYVGVNNKDVLRASNENKINPEILRLILPSESRLIGTPSDGSDILKITLTLRNAETGWSTSLMQLADLTLRDANGKLTADEKDRLDKMRKLFKTFDGTPAVLLNEDNTEIIRLSGKGPQILVAPTGSGDPLQLSQYRRYFGITLPNGADPSVYDLPLANKISEFQKEQKLVLEQAGVLGEETIAALDATIGKTTSPTSTLHTLARDGQELIPNGQFREADLNMLRALLGSAKPANASANLYDSALVAKVKEFQISYSAAFGLRTDGTIDAKTVNALTELQLQRNHIALRPGREYPAGFVEDKRHALISALTSAQNAYPLTEFERRVISRAQNSKYPDLVNKTFIQLVDIFQRHSGLTRPDGILGRKTTLQLLSNDSSTLAKIMVPLKSRTGQSVTAKNNNQ